LPSATLRVAVVLQFETPPLLSGGSQSRSQCECGASRTVATHGIGADSTAFTWRAPSDLHVDCSLKSPRGGLPPNSTWIAPFDLHMACSLRPPRGLLLLIAMWRAPNGSFVEKYWKLFEVRRRERVFHCAWLDRVLAGHRPVLNPVAVVDCWSCEADVLPTPQAPQMPPRTSSPRLKLR
jgi:hypothetical protein